MEFTSFSRDDQNSSDFSGGQEGVGRSDIHYDLFNEERSSNRSDALLENIRTVDPVRVEYCIEHPAQAVNLVCKKCDLPICILCKLTKHDRHKTSLLEEVAQEIKKKLVAQITSKSVQERFKHLEQEVSKLEASLNDLSDDLEKEILAMRRQEEELISQARKLASDKVTKVEERYNIAIYWNRNESDTYKENLKILSEMKANTKLLQDVNDEFEVIQEGTLLRSEIETCVRQTPPVHELGTFRLVQFEKKSLACIENIFGCVKQESRQKFCRQRFGSWPEFDDASKQIGKQMQFVYTN